LLHITEQLATQCPQGSAKLSCCIVQIPILTDTAKFTAETDTGISIQYQCITIYYFPVAGTANPTCLGIVCPGNLPETRSCN